MKLFNKVTSFFKSIYVAIIAFFYNRYVSFLIARTSRYASKLDKSIQHLGKLGVLDLSDPLITILAPSRATLPPTSSVPKVERPSFVGVPFTPKWVAASFVDQTKHPLYKGPVAPETKTEEVSTEIYTTIAEVVAQPSVEDTNVIEISETEPTIH